MAVPATVTVKDLSGTYLMNKSLSDDTEPMLKMQGIGWVVRQAAKYSSISTELKQYTDAEGHVHLDQIQTSTGGIQNSEDRIIDDQEHETDNKLWGKVRGKSFFTKASDIDEEYLREDWDGSADGELIRSVNHSVTNGWTADQVYGFSIVNGERKQVRRVVGKSKDGKVLKIRMVYDWSG